MAKKRIGSQRKAPSPRCYGEVWLLPGHPILFPGQPSSNHSILLLQNPDVLDDPWVERVLFAPISSFVLGNEWDFPIEIGQHDHCRLTKDCWAVLSCIQPMLKKDLESSAAIYQGHLNPEAMEEIGRLLWLQMGLPLP